MVSLPKRRKEKDNPYTLLIEDDQYYILFKDNKNILHKQSVSKEVFEIFNESELKENNMFSSNYRHISCDDITDELFYKRVLNNQISVEEETETKELINNLRIIINNLPAVQKRRLIKYYFDNKTYEEIANEEKCSKVAIKYSIDNAIKNISKNFKK